jgi:hypothetical protein
MFFLDAFILQFESDSLNVDGFDVDRIAVRVNKNDVVVERFITI